jgi:hypothetical protein
MGSNIGFDFDDCLAQGYSLMPVILFLERLLIKELRVKPTTKDVKAQLMRGRERFYEKLAENEFQTKGTMIRPSLLTILPLLLKLKKDGKIDSLFIYSNNSSIDLINVSDHILALTLLKLGVPADHLVKDDQNELHTLMPRIHRDAPCRSSEPIEAGQFRGKTVQGIQTCLGRYIAETDLWFLDDTIDHKDLIEKLKSQYIETKKYEIIMKNNKLAEYICTSFPKEAFNPMSELGKIFMSAYHALEQYFIITPPGEQYIVKTNPRFNPKGNETEARLAELLTRSLNAISPDAGGNRKAKWTSAETASDTNILMKALEPVLVGKSSTKSYNTPRILSTATAYREPIGGKRSVNKTRRKCKND